MTKEKIDRELIYSLSIKPFKDMLKEGIIEEIDYLKIDRLYKKNIILLLYQVIVPH